MTSQPLQHNSALRREIADKLINFKSRLPHDIQQDVTTGSKPLTSAAVAIAIGNQTDNNEACIYLTRRSSKLRKHAGQYALPGGKVDPGENTAQAALRELSEELGLELDESQILGTLDVFATRSGFIITPVIIWNNSTAPVTPNPDEVAKVFEIPLSELISPSLMSLQDTDTSQMLSIYTPAVGTSVYSPTAAIIYQFREVALLGNDTRVSHYEQPAFAWR